MPPLPLELCGDAISPLWRSFGHDVPPFAGIYSGITLSICPESLNAGLSKLTADLRPLRPTLLPLDLDAAELPAPSQTGYLRGHFQRYSPQLRPG
jgi:hypothetical protein